MEYFYKAFISYRHLTLDKKVADKLQKMLERYKIPKGLGKKEKWKIFRDETELPTSSNLSGDIKSALERSEFLIVICSRALKKSRWCMEEITYFKQLHKGSSSNIITLLIDGTPEETFPPELCTTSVETTDENGNSVTVETEVEPLAANIVSESISKSLRLLNSEFLRIAAPLIGCGYDNLYNRERRRKIKTITVAASFAFAVVAAFGIYNSVMLMRLNLAYNELAEKNDALDKANSDLLESNNALDESNSLLDMKNTELDESNSQLKITNKSLEEKTEEALQNLIEANSQRARAEEQQGIAEEQRNIAEENFNLLTESNNELLINAASMAASNAESLFESNDRIGALETALSVRPYNDDENKLLPVTKKVLTTALYVYNTSENPLPDRKLETLRGVSDWEYN
ncbi:MAG: TIR domain-containing protein, partial [Clostridiales bacterium]|nr:TIR domain-containing protein [Clostridiales bacterium]